MVAFKRKPREAFQARFPAYGNGSYELVLNAYQRLRQSILQHAVFEAQVTRLIDLYHPAAILAMIKRLISYIRAFVARLAKRQRQNGLLRRDLY